jgi:hypothetical protein
MLKRVVRWLVWALGGLVGLVVVLALIFLLVNLQDEPLDPRAAKLLEPAPPRLAEADNGFPDLVGLVAPAGADARAWGQEWLAGAAKVTNSSEARIFREKFKDNPVKVDEFCNPLVTSCLEKVATSRPAAEALLRTHRELLARYQRLFAYAGIEETYERVALASPGVFELVGSLRAAQRLHTTALALRVTDRDLAGALDLLERDAALARTLLGGARLLLTKIVVMDLFARDMALLSDLLRLRRAAMVPHAGRAARIAAPLTAAERSMERALQGEYRYLANTLLRFGRPEGRDDLTLDWVPSFAVRWLYQPQATVNLHHRLFEPILAIDTTKMPPVVPPPPPPPDLLWRWRAPYNLVGKIVITGGLPDFAAYAMRVGDLEGLQRLVALQGAIVARKIPTEDVAAFVAAQDGTLANPYTRQPMQWDAEKGQLGFAPRSKWGSDLKFGGKVNWLAVTP